MLVVCCEVHILLNFFIKHSQTCKIDKEDRFREDAFHNHLIELFTNYYWQSIFMSHVYPKELLPRSLIHSYYRTAVFVAKKCTMHGVDGRLIAPDGEARKITHFMASMFSFGCVK